MRHSVAARATVLLVLLCLACTVAHALPAPHVARAGASRTTPTVSAVLVEHLAPDAGSHVVALFDALQRADLRAPSRTATIGAPLGTIPAIRCGTAVTPWRLAPHDGRLGSPRNRALYDAIPPPVRPHRPR